MSRSGYRDYDGDENWDLIRWRGAVASAIRGKRGQAFLRELKTALEELPTHELVTNALQSECGVCTLGAIGLKRSIDMSTIDPEDREQVSKAFGIAESLAAEIEYLNDEHWVPETDSQRFDRMHAWVAVHIDGPEVSS